MPRNDGGGDLRGLQSVFPIERLDRRADGERRYRKCLFHVVRVELCDARAKVGGELRVHLALTGMKLAPARAAGEISALNFGARREDRRIEPPVGLPVVEP